MLKELFSLLKSDSLLDDAHKEAIEMVDVAEKMFTLVKNGLHNTETLATGEDIYDLDKRINYLEQKVRRKLYNHLIISSNKQIYSALILSNIVVDLERVGDYIKNAADLSRLTGGKVEFGKLNDEIIELENGVLKIIKEVKQCLINTDEEIALKILKNYYGMTKLCDVRVEKILTEEIKMDQRSAATLVLYYRYLKRIFAHFINVASAIGNPYDRIGFHPGDTI